MLKCPSSFCILKFSFGKINGDDFYTWKFRFDSFDSCNILLSKIMVYSFPDYSSLLQVFHLLHRIIWSRVVFHCGLEWLQAVLIHVL